MQKYIFGFVLSAIILSGCSVKPVEINLLTTDTEPAQEILDLGTAYQISETPFGVILPHDNIAKNQVGAFYEALEQIMKPKVIVILGENNSKLSAFNIRTCLGCLYKTDFGDLAVTEDIAWKLNKTKWSSAVDADFIDEKIISFHAPYIKNHFPNSKILPIAINEKTSLSDMDLLSTWLMENVLTDSLVIGSMNFADYISAETASFHDISAFNMINNFSFNDSYFQNVESPSVLYALMKLMQTRGMEKVTEVDKTNSEYLTREHLEKTTSHKFITFSEGKSPIIDGVSLLSFGNITEAFNLPFSKGWQPDPSYDSAADISDRKLMRDIRAREDRFLRGSDFLIFDLIDNACSTEDKNNIKVLFCKFSEDSEFERSEMYEMIKTQGADTDLVYLLYDYQFNSDGAKATAKAFADNGVDIFVGRGLKEVSPFSMYNGSLLFYSLGDFITENKLVTELSGTSSGVVIGLYITPSHYQIFPFPVAISNGYPKLLDHSARGKFYLDFRENAGIPYDAKVDAQNGSITVRR